MSSDYSSNSAERALIDLNVRFQALENKYRCYIKEIDVSKPNKQDCYNEDIRRLDFSSILQERSNNYSRNKTEHLKQDNVESSIKREKADTKHQRFQSIDNVKKNLFNTERQSRERRSYSQTARGFINKPMFLSKPKEEKEPFVQKLNLMSHFVNKDQTIPNYAKHKINNYIDLLYIECERLNQYRNKNLPTYKRTADNELGNLKYIIKIFTKNFCNKLRDLEYKLKRSAEVSENRIKKAEKNVVSIHSNIHKKYILKMTKIHEKYSRKENEKSLEILSILTQNNANIERIKSLEKENISLHERIEKMHNEENEKFKEIILHRSGQNETDYEKINFLERENLDLKQKIEILNSKEHEQMRDFLFVSTQNEAHIDRIQSLEKEKIDLSNKLIILKDEENEKLKEIFSLREENDTNKHQIMTLDRKVIELKNKIKDLRNEINVFISKNINLQKILKRKQRKTKIHSKINRNLERYLCELSEKHTIHKSLQIEKTDTKENEQLKSDIIKLNNEIDTLNEDFYQILNKKNSEINSLLESLKTQKEFQYSDIESVQEDKTKLTQELNQHLETIVDLEKKESSLLNTIGTLKLNLESEQIKQNKTHLQIKKLKALCIMYRKNSQELEKSLSLASENHQQKTKIEENLSEKETYTKAWLRRSKSLNKIQLSSMRSLENNIRHKEENSQFLRHKIKTLEAQLVLEREKYEEICDDLNKTITHLQFKRKPKTKNKSFNTEDQDISMISLFQNQIDKLSKEKANLIRQKEKESSKVEVLAQSIEELHIKLQEKDSIIADLTQDFDSLNYTLEKTYETIDILQKAKELDEKIISELNSQLSNKQEFIISHKTETAHLKIIQDFVMSFLSVDVIEDISTTVISIIQSYYTEVSSLRGDPQSMTKFTKLLEEKIEDLKIDNYQLKRQLSTKAKPKGDLTVQILPSSFSVFSKLYRLDTCFRTEIKESVLIEPNFKALKSPTEMSSLQYSGDRFHFSISEEGSPYDKSQEAHYRLYFKVKELESFIFELQENLQYKKNKNRIHKELIAMLKLEIAEKEKKIQEISSLDIIYLTSTFESFIDSLGPLKGRSLDILRVIKNILSIHNDEIQSAKII